VDLRRASAQTLAQIEPKPPGLVPALKTALGDEDGLVRVHAAAALGALPGQAEDALDVLIRALDDSSLRLTAIAALRHLGPAAKGAMPVLAAMLTAGGETSLLIPAAYALARIGGPEAFELLERALDRVDPRYRPLIVEALGQTGPRGLEALSRLLDHEDPIVRTMAVRILGLHARRHEELRPALRDALGDRDRDVRVAAIQTQANLGSEAEDALPRLSEILKEEPASLRVEAAVAVARIEGKVTDTTRPILLAAAGDRSQAGQWRVIQALGRLGPPAVPALIRALREDNSVSVRLKAAESLGRIGPDAHEAAPALIEALTTPDWPTRAQAALALWAVDHQAERALPVLIDALKAPALRPRPDAATMPILPGSATLGYRFSYGSDASSNFLYTTYPAGTSQFVPVVNLVALRRQIVEALGQMGPRAKAAAPVLTEVAREENEDVRRAAEEALEKLQRTED
jgi:HEAT repeat protein